MMEHTVVADDPRADDAAVVAVERVNFDEHAGGGLAERDVDDVDGNAGHEGNFIERHSLAQH